MKNIKKLLALILVTALCLPFALPAFAADGGVSYAITNPYETVDWDNWNRYRAQLHTHTLYSDGRQNITDVVEAYYALGYDILAITDHGVVNTGWNKKHQMIPVIGYNALIKPFDVKPMSDERYAEITTGADRGGRGMLDVPLGIEMNALNVRKNHVNGYFCGWGQGYLGKEEDYETSIAETEKAGGISVINHPGDFFHANQNRARAYDWNNLMIFADSLLKHPKSCVGVEAFNGFDTADRYDRIIWDNLLMYCIPRGRNVFAFSNDDSHYDDDIGITAEIMLMPENTAEALRTAMETGTFFACSTIARDEMGEDFRGNGNFANVRRITVDDENDVITVDAENADAIEWVADGVVIATGPSISLREHADEIGAYVRFQIKNEGGLLLSQAFICDDGNMQSHLIAEPVPESHPFIVQKLLDLVDMMRRTLLGEALYRKFVLEKD
ncbi:MAG: hypothetical protein IK104_09300 [Clostridia bacterium]|nr:hypothetical protein [Clostridia bacterium]